MNKANMTMTKIKPELDGKRSGTSSKSDLKHLTLITGDHRTERSVLNDISYVNQKFAAITDT